MCLILLCVCFIPLTANTAAHLLQMDSYSAYSAFSPSIFSNYLFQKNKIIYYSSVAGHIAARRTAA